MCCSATFALPRAALGDLLAVAIAGAYTLSMASNYNLVPPGAAAGRRWPRA